MLYRCRTVYKHHNILNGFKICRYLCTENSRIKGRISILKSPAVIKSSLYGFGNLKTLVIIGILIKYYKGSRTYVIYGISRNYGRQIVNSLFREHFNICRSDKSHKTHRILHLDTYKIKRTFYGKKFLNIIGKCRIIIYFGSGIFSSFFVFYGDHNCSHCYSFGKKLGMKRHQKKLRKRSQTNQRKEINHYSLCFSVYNLPIEEKHNYGKKEIHYSYAVYYIFCPISVEFPIFRKIVYPMSCRINKHKQKAYDHRKFKNKMTFFLSENIICTGDK